MIGGYSGNFSAAPRLDYIQYRSSVPYPKLCLRTAYGAVSKPACFANNDAKRYTRFDVVPKTLV